VHQYGHKHAAFRVVENPRHDDAKSDGKDAKLHDSEEAADGSPMDIPYDPIECFRNREELFSDDFRE
jgi:hypothetical protein